MNDPIREGAKIFFEIADEFGDRIEHDRAESFFRRLLDRTRGLVILDFLDTANWDMFESFSFDLESKNLALVWHDYGNKVESEEERDVRKLAFPGESYGLHIKLRAIETIRGKSVCVFAIKGYATDDKELKRLYEQGSGEFHFENESFFSKGIYTKTGADWRVIRAHHTPLYSIAIVPKNCGMSAFDSRKILFLKNYQECEERLLSVISELETIHSSNEDGICEKAASTRRILENILKIECCFNDVLPKRGYSHLRLGDLVTLIKDGKDDSEVRILNHLVVSLNKLSHDSGYPVVKEEAQLAALMAINYLKLRPFEVKYGVES